MKKKVEHTPLNEKFDNFWKLVCEQDIELFENIDDLDGLEIMMKIALPPEKGGFFKIFQSVLFCMSKYKYENEDSILFVFAIPYPKDKSRDANDLILKIMRAIEEKYSYFDYSKLKIEKEYKYLIIIKKIKEDIFI